MTSGVFFEFWGFTKAGGFKYDTHPFSFLGGTADFKPDELCAGGLGKRAIVRRDQGHSASLAAIAEERGEHLDTPRIQPVRGLVEHEQEGLTHERRREAGPPPLAERHAPHGLLEQRRDAKPFEQRGGRNLDLLQRGAKGEELTGEEVRRRIGSFRHEAKPSTRGGSAADQGFSLERDRARLRLDNARDDAEQRGFSRAVRPDHRDGLAPLDHKLEAPEDFTATEAFLYSFDDEAHSRCLRALRWALKGGARSAAKRADRAPAKHAKATPAASAASPR